MKKAGYIILLLSLLGSVQTFSELVKAPLVLVHVLEHLVKDEQFSLTEFWEMHYISEPGRLARARTVGAGQRPPVRQHVQ